jgi:hypothetical protein
VQRRDFLNFLGASVAGSAWRGLEAQRLSKDRWVAIQIGAVSFVDEGVEQVLDILQERAAVNVLIPAVFSFSSGTAGRQLKGHPFPGHGKPSSDGDVHGGNFSTVHGRHYHNTGIDPLKTQAPDHPGFDVLAALQGPCRKRDMKVIALVQDQIPEDFPGVEKLQERDFNGQRAETLCKNNPYYRSFLAGLVTDMVRSYDVDGVMLVAEHQGALSNTLGSRLRGKARGKPGTRTCFCQYCLQRGKQAGIAIERLNKGFSELERFVASGRHGSGSNSSERSHSCIRLGSSRGARTGACKRHVPPLRDQSEILAVRL